MSRTTAITVRLSGTLSDFVAGNVGQNESYENIGEYVRDLIRTRPDVVETSIAPSNIGEMVGAFIIVAAQVSAGSNQPRKSR